MERNKACFAGKKLKISRVKMKALKKSLDVYFGVIAVL